jgi:two-component sensor histidine kinase
MVLHELTTNAVKYGALSVPAGRVKVEWSPAAGERFVFRWAETAAHRSSRPPARPSFGTRVLDQIIRAELGGEVSFHWRAEGLACEIAFQSMES